MSLYQLTPKDELLYLDPTWMTATGTATTATATSSRAPMPLYPYRDDTYTTNTLATPASSVTPDEYRERAYIAASRRTDRSLEAKMESARRASSLHHKRTGRWLQVDERDVLGEESYREVQGAARKAGDGSDADVDSSHSLALAFADSPASIESGPSQTASVSGKPSFWMIHESLRSQIGLGDVENDLPLYNPYTSTNLRMLFGLPLNGDKAIDLETGSGDLVKLLEKLDPSRTKTNLAGEGEWPARNTVIDALTFEQARGSQVPLSASRVSSPYQPESKALPSAKAMKRHHSRSTTSAAAADMGGKRPRLDHPRSSYLVPQIEPSRADWLASGGGGGGGGGDGSGGVAGNDALATTAMPFVMDDVTKSVVDWDDFIGSGHFVF